MLSISKPLSPERAFWYFKRDDYYLTQEGEWYGGLTDDLKLSGPIKQADFLKLLEGFDQSGNKLVASAGAKDVKDGNGNIKKHGHRSGIDLTFSAPKSVSILSYHDPEINEAFKRALHTTLNHIEKEFAHTQSKDKRGLVHAERTNKLLWSTFVHDTSRELDPQLHCHCVLMNLTRDSKGKYKTLHNDSLYKNKMYLGQHFRSQLAQELKKIGYKIEVSDQKRGFFEISGVGDKVIEVFSKRSKQVREEMKKLRKLEYKDLSKGHLIEWAKERTQSHASRPDYEEIVQQEAEKLSRSNEKVYENFSDSRLASLATTNSRVAKRDVSRNYVTDLVEKTCMELGTSLKNLHKSAISAPSLNRPKTSSREILISAISGMTEGQSTFTRHSLIAESLKMGIGAYTQRDFEREFNKMLKEGNISFLGSVETKASRNSIYSSREMIDIENSVIAMCKEARSTSAISVEKSITDDFIFRTDMNLKMKSFLGLTEKDPVKSEYLFKSVLAKIDDPAVKEKFIKLRDQALKRMSDSSVSPVDACDHPDLHNYFEKFGYGFTPGQRDALKLIASTRDGFSLIQGDAGTGKSFSCLYARRLLEGHGFTVRGFAPTGKATTGLALSAEIPDSNYSTIDSFLLRYKNADPEKQQTMFSKGKEVWIVDEAGMCGSRKFLEFMKVAREADAKVVFIGDRKQFQSIEAGRMFSELQDKAGIDMVIMPDVMRQKTAQTKEIVKAISLKDMDFAFNVMQGYKKVSGSFNKADLSNYSIGSTIQFTNGFLGLSPDTRCTVKAISGSNGLTLEYFDEGSLCFKVINFDPSKFDAFDVYRPPLNHHSLSRYNLGDRLNLSLPEQELPSTTLEIKEIHESNLVVTYKDPEKGSVRKVSFDPTKNPDNISHFTASGTEKLSSSREAYENMITVESDRDKSLALVAQDYLASVSARKDCLLITGTNKNKDALNDIIRPELVKQGLITDSKSFNVFQTKSLAGTSAMAADSYKPGQVIITNEKCGSLPKGTQAEIEKINRTENSIAVRFWDKSKGTYSSADIEVRENCKKFNTYDQQIREFGVGDLIIFLKNDKKTVKVNNGDTARILSIDEEGNVCARIESSEDKREVVFNINNRGPKAYNYVSHAYAITDYKSQGATTSRLLWYAPTQGGPVSSNTFYVAITRCKEEVGVYTDNVDALRDMVRREQQKDSTLDYTMDSSKSFKSPQDQKLRSVLSLSISNICSNMCALFYSKNEVTKDHSNEGVSLNI